MVEVPLSVILPGPDILPAFHRNDLMTVIVYLHV